MNEIYIRFRENIINNKMVSSGDRIILSMSAGKDSVALFYLMERLKNELPFETVIFHLNHLTRGDESDKDEEYLEDLAQKNGVVLYSTKHDFSQSKSRLSFEEEARDIRYSLIEELSVKTGFKKTAIAHNYDDNAETVLMRILSGTGIKGLGGIEANTGKIIRPLLIFTADEIYSYLKNNNIGWREDCSNTDDKYLRNFVRNRVFPMLEKRFENPVKNINRLSVHARENEDLLNSLVFEKYKDSFSIEENSFTIFMSKLPDNESLIKFILSRLVYQVFGERLTLAIISEILKKYNSERSNLVVYQNAQIIIEKKFINNEKILNIYDTKLKKIPLREWTYSINARLSPLILIDEIKKKISIERVDNKFFVQNMLNESYVFLALPDKCDTVIIRSRKKGDRISLENGWKKIKDLMIEKKLDTFSKSIVPLIEINNSIAAFLPGFVGLQGNRVAYEFKVNNKSDVIIAINCFDSNMGDFL